MPMKKQNQTKLHNTHQPIPGQSIFQVFAFHLFSNKIITGTLQPTKISKALTNYWEF